MRLDWTLACRYAEASDGTATIVGAGTDTLLAATFPVAAVLRLVARVAGSEAEFAAGIEHELMIQQLRPRMTTLDELRIPDRPGAYSFELALDGRHAKSIPILVSAA